MRSRLLLLLSASVVAAVAVVAPNASASIAASSPMPVVPASAGRLVNGPAVVSWPRGSAHHETVVGSDRDAATSAGNNLTYGGGPATGTIVATPAVYVVLWGSQWSKTDPAAAYLTRFLQGLYGPGDDWTSVSQQYCEGIAAGESTCPATATHVGVPDGALVKGVWFDDSAPAVPISAVTAAPSLDQMGAEAVRAAAHFGNTAPGSNISAQYVIALPSMFLAPGEGYYCAYHSSVSSNYGDVAYTNLPYLADLGALSPVGNDLNCGQNAVNAGAAGTYDGISIFEGHEFMETLTDMLVLQGWRDSVNTENGDKCEWIHSGQGAMANLTLSTGTFAVQSTWSNAFDNGNGGCVLHDSSSA